MDSNSEDVKVAGNTQKYTGCPQVLENWCLADFVSCLDICNKPTVNSSDVEDTENGEDEVVEDTHADDCRSDYDKLQK